MTKRERFRFRISFSFGTTHALQTMWESVNICIIVPMVTPESLTVEEVPVKSRGNAADSNVFEYRMDFERTAGSRFSFRLPVRIF